MASTPSCLQHALNPVSAYCVRCGRPMCELCTFWVGSAIFCPECISSGPSADERSGVTIRGVLSIGLAVLGVLALVGLLAGAAAMGSGSEAFATAMGFVVLLAMLGGIALGLIAREGARRTGSMLPLVGVILSGLGLGLYGILTVIGLAS